jgi:hypothetical protein
MCLPGVYQNYLLVKAGQYHKTPTALVLFLPYIYGLATTTLIILYGH